RWQSRGGAPWRGRGSEICILHDQSQHFVRHGAADELAETGPVPLPPEHIDPKTALDGARDARVGGAAFDSRGIHGPIGMSRDRPVIERARAGPPSRATAVAPVALVMTSPA